ncbi:RNA-directed RNA polymerase [ssRNA phage SRR6960549_4]|uniref:RNA-directed RNA polymerase n=1 Tax=ssRNA phage SRR6960549_4 TaxID=2786541 RepID=A0A8S5L5E4_9VIRU|nr:RNA-directed RNA polymerase [ssRNA phage SRR6960549_4]DAD52597.1 TPA_asm: RNA-directed RNA polymerase [ssRNA phage SRR6960549_4]
MKKAKRRLSRVGGRRETTTPQLLRGVFFALCKKADTPVSLSLWLMFKYGEFEQLVRKEVDPGHYNDREEFDKDWLVSRYLRKQADLPTGIDVDLAAMQSWQAAEVRNAETNARLRRNRSEATAPDVESVMFIAQRKIATLLSKCSIKGVFDRCKWGPGATFDLKGEFATVADKIGQCPISVTQRALPWLKTVMEADPHWCQVILGADVDGPLSLLPSCFNIVRGCRGTLVLKDARTKRSIAIEPTGNCFIQLGVDAEWRRVLKSVGVDLDDQTWNQCLAKVFSGDFLPGGTTLDVKDASNSLCRELIYRLFPVEWSILLDQLRSPEIQWDNGEWHRLEMFSSMGNGFTFVLESMVFWALASASCEYMGTEELLGIYGDDIACPSSVAPLLTRVLAHCGFSINTEKSYGTGYFRESCGRHYWDGFDVTPVYQKEPPRTLPEAYRMANRLHRAAFARCGTDEPTDSDSWLGPAWRQALGVIEQTLADKRGVDPATVPGEIWERIAKLGGHGVPFFEGDDGLMLPLRRLKHYVIELDDDGRFKLPILPFRPKRREAPGLSLLAYILRFEPRDPLDGKVAVRRRGRYQTKTRWFSTAFWHRLSTLSVEVV